ncbi:hypothetical protein [Campylobacter hyointestinalis]|uniref:Uncharacterized protein n=1 Tax=Campylobacter hyointestinalis subsp. hyointestinalis TaxID=91352 RepID=A0A9W5ARX1_CAMHY|nr:hypothetical protein [Campylobacter hyointestinalis]PPB74787.1 hypothetical protein CDQ80_06545 [Campylobacter hyointestinalis subsp. hyointestinalis]PPB76383.1 hypothetical protein CDQ82_08360 [Campylobacter hyointestinalis subsp. hyointestinalis]CUU74275.1 Uncharacterised protein [Campylobacter hyointestinalis subsp. hyointestinalis]CUU82304.1 Uncharacterised protein [Campylobacter hyointestinalis subsp. hyointestinalis]
MKKIIYMYFGTMTENLYKALCIDAFIKNNILVELIDLNELFFNYQPSKVEKYDIKSIQTYEELEKYLSINNDGDNLFNIQFLYETRFFKFFRLITKYKCNVSIFEIGTLPNIGTKENFIERIKMPLRTSRRFLEIIFDKIIYRVGLVNIDYKVNFVAGKLAYDIAKYRKPKYIININYIDYEKFKQMKVDHSSMRYLKPEKKYFVFLDIYLIGHEDFKFTNKTDKFDNLRYLNSLNSFFDKLEKQFNVDIIIAAHPKSNYIGNEFEHRKIIKNMTDELVYSADLIISHHSTSISFAILNKLPIIFLSTNNIYKTYTNIFLLTKKISSILGMPFINLDDDYSIVLEDIDKEKYNIYKYNYLTSKESEMYTNERIIKQWLKSSNIF